MSTSYPNVRDCAPPPFLFEKYHDLQGLMAEVSRQAQGKLPPFDAERFFSAFPTLEAAFDASRPELIKALGVDADAGEKYCVLIQRLMLWPDPADVLALVEGMLERVITDMPRTLAEIEGTRDVIDPFIVSFVSRMIGKDNPNELIKALVSHKCLMKLEDLVGNMHQEILGRAAGCERVAEPQGVEVEGKKNKELWHETLNPYPGADVRRGDDEFYQVKNKTGSANGPYGGKLGQQFLQLKEHYPNAKRFYISMIGRTLSGHRSMTGFLRVDSGAEVLVGLSAFQQLGKHRDTPDIALELYVEAFEEALRKKGYDFPTVVTDITKEWIDKHGKEDPAYAILRDIITAPDYRVQTSKTYGKVVDATEDVGPDEGLNQTALLDLELDSEP